MNAAMQSRLGLAVVCLGASVGPFDTTVNTAFPVITAAFGLAPGAGLNTGYAIVRAPSSSSKGFANGALRAGGGAGGGAGVG